MKKAKQRKIEDQRGFSLLEMILALSITVLLCVITISILFTGKSEVGGAERVLDEASARLTERRADAIRMNGDDRRAMLEHFVVSPLPIDFLNLETTGSLRINGTDEDRDCIDDYTQASMTCLQIRGEYAEWQLAANDDWLKLPDGWQIAQSIDSIGKLPLIGEGNNGRGVLATSIGFDATGKALAIEPGGSSWQKYPTGAIQTDSPSTESAPFWAIYFIASGKGKNSDTETDIIVLNKYSTPQAAVAIAVHPSGLIEQFRYDGNQWIGFKNRTIK